MTQPSLPLPRLRGQTPPWVRIWHRLKNKWRKIFPRHHDGMTLRAVLGLPERRRLTAEELAEIKRQQLQKRDDDRRDNTYRRNARLFARKAAETLDSPCDIRHVTERKRGRRVQRVEFLWRYSENGHVVYLKADTAPGHFPHGHNLAELTKPEIVRIVACNLGRIVEPWGDQRPTGGGYVVFANIGAEGFPLFVDYSDMWLKHMSASIAKDNWAIPLGLSFNSKPWWRSVPDMGHVLIAGAPGYGKSIRANSMICALIENNEPWQAEFIFVDFKGGVEFKFYRGLPHLKQVPRYFIRRKKEKAAGEDEDLPETIEETYQVKQVKDSIPGLITQPLLMPGLLYWINLEAQRRFKIISESADVKNVSEYNRWAHLHGRAPIPRLLVWIDEWAVVAYNRAISGVCTDLLTTVSNVARAAGIQFFICTQHPNRDVLPGAVLATADTKIIYRIPDQYMSRSILQTDEACRLDTKGRCLVSGPGMENVLMQGPYISNERIRGVVDDAIKSDGKISAERRKGIPVSADEIFRWALASNGGFLGVREVFEQFRSRGMSQAQTKKFIASYEADIVTVGERQFLVAPETDFPNRQPRRLLARGDDAISTNIRRDDDPAVKPSEADSMFPDLPRVTCQELPELVTDTGEVKPNG